MNVPNEFPTSEEPLKIASKRHTDAPLIVKQYKMYAAFMAVFHLVFVAVGLAILQRAPEIMAQVPAFSEADLRVRAFAIIGVGAALFVAFLAALFLPKSPGAWVYHLVMISIGLPHCFLWLATIPLMTAWLKPEAQIWFGRAVPGVLPARNTNVPPPI